MPFSGIQNFIARKLACLGHRLGVRSDFVVY